jgi:sugar phosphate isomerase/epimerase
MAFPNTISGEGPVIETLEKIALDDFFSAVEVRRAISPEILAAEKKLLSESAMEPIVAGQPPLLLGKLNLNDLDESGRQAAVADVKASVDEAYELGATIVAVLSGPDPGDAERAQAVDALVRSLSEAGAYAKERANGASPVYVSLETFDRTVDKKCLVGPTPLAAEVMEKVKQSVDNVGLTVDLSHQPLLNETAQEMIGGAKDHLIHVHVGNAYFDRAGDPAYGDQHPRFGYPGSVNGVAALTEFLGELKAAGYLDRTGPTRRPVISFEIKPVPGETPELIIAGAKRVFREAWSAA